MKKYPDDFYLIQSEPQKSVFLVLRDIILAHDPDISETVKYGMPCFLYKKNILCYLWMDRKTGEPYILMAEGNYLRNPDLEQGDRARMKILRIDPCADLPVKKIGSVLDEALDLYKTGTVKLK